MWTAPEVASPAHFAERLISSRPGGTGQNNRRRHVSQLLGLWPRSSPVAAKRGVADAGLEVGYEPRDHQDGRLHRPVTLEAESILFSIEQACLVALIKSARSPVRNLLATRPP